MSDASVSDEALLAGMAVRDEGAGVAFVRRYQRRVYGLAVSIIGDPAQAQDIAQEAFLRAWLHAPVFDRRRGSVTTWLLTITRNLSIDAIRLRRAIATGPDDHVWLNLVDNAISLDEHAAGNDVSARLSAALASMPREQSRALVLSAAFGYTAEEVSRREGVPLGTAKSRVRRGLLRLRSVLEAADARAPGQLATGSPGEGGQLGGSAAS